MYGLLGFLAVSMTILRGTQSASIGDGPLGMNFFKLAKWWVDKNDTTELQPPRQLQHLHQPTVTPPSSPAPVLPRPTVFTTVTVQRYAYVELKCPIEGSPVVWTVPSGQTDYIHGGQMLIFPRMAGDVEQQYQCQVSDSMATVHVHIIADIPHDKTDAVSNICEHGKVCPISCGAAAEWDGVAIVKERWTALRWPTSKQVDPSFISNGFMVADMFTTPSRMACNYVYSITAKGTIESGLPIGTELTGQKKVYNITINPPRPQILTPYSCYDDVVVKPVCVGKPATIQCNGLMPYVDVNIGADIFWLQQTTNGTTFLPADDPSLRERSVESPISESRLGASKGVELIFDPVKKEHLKHNYICKIQSSVHSTFKTVALVAKRRACL